MRREPSKD